MANILYRWGRYDDALQLATYARVGNEYEVSCFGIGEMITQVLRKICLAETVQIQTASQRVVSSVSSHFVI